MTQVLISSLEVFSSLQLLFVLSWGSLSFPGGLILSLVFSGGLSGHPLRPGRG